MKKFSALLLICCFVLSLAGCGEVQRAEATVDKMFAAIKSLDFQEAQKYVNIEDVADLDDKSDEDEYVKLIMEKIFGRLEYEIVSSEKIDNDTVVVKTKITSTDMRLVMADYLTKALEYAFSAAFADPQPTEEEAAEEMEKILIECLSKPDSSTVTNEVNIRVTKTKSNDWRIEADDAFVNALLGGLVDATKEMGDALDSLE